MFKVTLDVPMEFSNTDNFSRTFKCSSFSRPGNIDHSELILRDVFPCMSQSTFTEVAKSVWTVTVSEEDNTVCVLNARLVGQDFLESSLRFHSVSDDEMDKYRKNNSAFVGSAQVIYGKHN